MSVANRPRTRSAPFVASLVILLLSVSCSSVSGGIQSPRNPPEAPSATAGGQQVGHLVVTLDRVELPPEVTDVAELYEVTRILDNRVREQLVARGMVSGGELEVDVRVIGMRLRSNGTAIWWGVFAGGAGGARGAGPERVRRRSRERL